jgi:acetate kinase
MSVLAINAGSSSIRFAFYDPGEPLARLLGGKLERIGSKDARLTANAPGEDPPRHLALEAPDFSSAVSALMGWLEREPIFADVTAVGHRVVHGMQRTEPVAVTPALIEELARIATLDPEHLPQEIELMRTLGAKYPRLGQVACFDTAFHSAMPRVAALLAIPRRYESKGVRRYGFHGLSYTYLVAELERLGDRTAARGRVVLAHLGSGASLAAVRDGRCIDTSMGFTPAAGIPMGTRSGDVDPGLVGYLARTEGMDAAAFDKMANHESGLLGLSETSSDIRDLLARAGDDARAAEAVEIFCYQTKKWVAAFAGALGGLDTLVFAGGIGEHAPAVRARICAGLEFLGLGLSAAKNALDAPIISSDTSTVTVRVIPTDEESVIADITLKVLAGAQKPPPLSTERTP